MFKDLFVNLQRQNLVRHMAAAFGQRFLCHFRWNNYTASRGVLVTAPKVCTKTLTARNAVFLLSKFKIL
jgi:hypothetical protein